MARSRSGRRAGGLVAISLSAALVAGMLAWPAAAAPVSRDEVAALCAQADGPNHCGRLIEEVQLKRLPNLAVRDGATLKVSLYPAGVASFVDTEALNGGRSYSLWDYLDGINAVLLYTTDGDTVTFTLVQRANGRKVELPTEPKLSPDRQLLVTADFCESRCVNELALWRVSREGVRKESAWKPAQAWSDATATWKSPETLVIEYQPAGAAMAEVLERRIADPSWVRATPR
jgi:hypothetical protein